jgi:oligoendopeptidase F
MTFTYSTRWNLEDLLPEGEQALESILEEIESCAKTIEAYRPLLENGLGVSKFLELLHTRERLIEKASVIECYAFLKHATDTQSPQAISLQDRLDQILTEIDNRLLFINLWFKSLDDEQAVPYIAAAGDLAYYLRSIRRLKPHTLSEAEEKIINLKDSNGAEGLVKIYEVFTNGFEYQLEIDGKMMKLTRDGLNRYYRDPSPELRAAAFKELYRAYTAHKTILAQIFFFLVRDWCTEQKLRGYPRPVSVRNLGNDLPDGVVDTLLEVCRRNAGLYQRYFKLKARLLGMKRLRRCDIYAPLARAETKIELREAIHLVLDSFEQFSPVLAKAAARVFEENHLDADVYPGKRGGAFSMSVTQKHTPYVLINFSGRLSDTATLAHELGHAVHTILACEHSVLNYHAPQPLAETASVFAEMLLTDRLLQEEKDPAVQRDLLITILDDSYATVARQAFISIFEQEAYQRIADGCTSEELAEYYLESLGEQFGDAVDLSDEFAWEWLTIPHIYTSPFYPYAYSFGQLLVLALYQQYLDEGETFTPRYLKLLSYGGSAQPQAILAEAGLDIQSAEFWQGGFDVLERTLQRLEGIVGD